MVECRLAGHPRKFERADDRIALSANPKGNKRVGHKYAAEIKLIGVVLGIRVEQGRRPDVFVIGRRHAINIVIPYRLSR